MKTPADAMSREATDQIRTHSSRARLQTEILTVALFLVVSLLVMHHRTIFSPLAITEGGGDSVLYNITLEHEWRWVSGEPVHRSLWSPPIFFPKRETAAYTDLFLGVFPPYAAWRLLGAGAQTAFQLWMLTMSTLNYAAAYLVLRLLVRTSIPASGIGALLFAFGSPRLAEIGHQQLLPGFFEVAAFAGLYLLFSEPPAALKRRRLVTGFLLVAGGVTAQFYTAFYYAWFMAFCVSVALVFALLVSPFRRRLAAFLRQYWLPSGISILTVAVLLAPAVGLYYRTLKDVGPREYTEVQHFLPNSAAWLAQGPDHWIYGPLNRRAGINRDFGDQVMFDGIGLVTTGLVLTAFVRFRRRPVVMIWGAICGAILLTTLAWPGGFSLWRLVYDYFPGAHAVRAVSRFGVFVLLPASIALALGIDWLANRVSPLAAVVCMLVVLVEQAGSLGGAPAYSTAGVQAPAEAIVHQLRPDCKAFLVSYTAGTTSVPWMHIYGMWAELLSGLPTLNGYSGQVPPGWPLENVAIANRADHDRLYTGIQDWMRRYPQELDNVCWITPDSHGTILIRRSDAARGYRQLLR